MMDVNEYQQLAQRTSNTILPDDKIVNGLLGLFGEGGECADVYKKYRYQRHEFDREHMAKELGDVMWYASELATGLGYTLEDICRMNIAKLEARYPGAVFDADKSMNRKEGDV